VKLSKRYGETLETLYRHVDTDSLEQVRARLGLGQDEACAGVRGCSWEQSNVKDALAIRAEERAMSYMARLTLEGRFGTLGEDVVEALDALNRAALEQLGVRTATDTLEKIRERLGLNHGE